MRYLLYTYNDTVDIRISRVISQDHSSIFTHATQKHEVCYTSQDKVMKGMLFDIVQEISCLWLPSYMTNPCINI